MKRSLTSLNVHQGFTLVEILVVISIILILISVSMVFLYNARTESRDMGRETMVEQLRLAVRLYKEAYGSYPSYSSYGAADPIPIGVGNTIDTDLAPFTEIKTDPLSSGTPGSEYNFVYIQGTRCVGAIKLENEVNRNVHPDCGQKKTGFWLPADSVN